MFFTKWIKTKIFFFSLTLSFSANLDTGAATYVQTATYVAELSLAFVNSRKSNKNTRAAYTVLTVYQAEMKCLQMQFFACIQMLNRPLQKMTLSRSCYAT